MRRIEQTLIEEKTIDEICDMGLALFRSGVLSSDDDKKYHGLEYMTYAYRKGDPEAAAWVGLFLYCGILKVRSGDSADAAVNTLIYAAYNGSMTARVFLNKLCADRYEHLMSKSTEERKSTSGPLVDFEGRRIVINRSGKRFPVDAVLEYRDGINLLTFSLNIYFVYDDLPNPSAFKNAVIRGIKEWEGVYRVFGGQTLQVAINVSTDDRLSDSVFVAAVTKSYAKVFERIPGFLRTESGKKNIDNLINQKRSMASTGFFKWSTRSAKFIFIASQDDSFNDYSEIESAAKHEFGHVLGLGDLYQSASEQLTGVERGTYSELDGYYISDLFYNLVMCDHHGPVSNNDIEMVVLAFCDDEFQLYQNDPRYKRLQVSKALGKGN